MLAASCDLRGPWSVDLDAPWPSAPRLAALAVVANAEPSVGYSKIPIAIIRITISEGLNLNAEAYDIYIYILVTASAMQH